MTFSIIRKTGPYIFIDIKNLSTDQIDRLFHLTNTDVRAINYPKGMQHPVIEACIYIGETKVEFDSVDLTIE